MLTSPADNQQKLTDDFQFIFTALTQLGHDPNAMIDCSEVIPIPKDLTPEQLTPMFPAGKTNADVEQAVRLFRLVLYKSDTNASRSSARTLPSRLLLLALDLLPQFHLCMFSFHFTRSPR